MEEDVQEEPERPALVKLIDELRQTMKEKFAKKEQEEEQKRAPDLGQDQAQEDLDNESQMAEIDQFEIHDQLRNAQLRQIQVFVAISESRLYQINYDLEPPKLTFCESVFEFFNTDDPALHQSLDYIARQFLQEYIKLLTGKPRHSDQIETVRNEILVCLKSRLHMN
jgi:hypothetical protein